MDDDTTLGDYQRSLPKQRPNKGKGPVRYTPDAYGRKNKKAVFDSASDEEEEEEEPQSSGTRRRMRGSEDEEEEEEPAPLRKLASRRGRGPTRRRGRK